MAETMRQTPESHATSNFRLLLTGDEPRMFNTYHHEAARAALRQEVDELEQPMHYHRKTTAAALFNGTGEY
jgi:hypothetical protein